MQSTVTSVVACGTEGIPPNDELLCFNSEANQLVVRGSAKRGRPVSLEGVRFTLLRAAVKTMVAATPAGDGRAVRRLVMEAIL